MNIPSKQRAYEEIGRIMTNTPESLKADKLKALAEKYGLDRKQKQKQKQKRQLHFF